jgi:hypothetical protein
VTQIDARLLPVPFQRALGHAAHGANLGEREPAEVAKVDQLRERRVVYRELVERLAEPGQFVGIHHGLRHVRVQRGQMHLAAAPLLRLAIPDVVDDQAAHDARGIGHEPAAIGKHRVVAPGHGDVRLVQECGDAKRG